VQDDSASADAQDELERFNEGIAEPKAAGADLTPSVAAAAAEPTAAAAEGLSVRHFTSCMSWTCDAAGDTCTDAGAASREQNFAAA
jgi:hypothetical protein